VTVITSMCFHKGENHAGALGPSGPSPAGYPDGVIACFGNGTVTCNLGRGSSARLRALAQYDESDVAGGSECPIAGVVGTVTARCHLPTKLEAHLARLWADLGGWSTPRTCRNGRGACGYRLAGQFHYFQQLESRNRLILQD
jgi:hypothetical protein